MAHLEDYIRPISAKGYKGSTLFRKHHGKKMPLSVLLASLKTSRPEGSQSSVTGLKWPPLWFIRGRRRDFGVEVQPEEIAPFVHSAQGNRKMVPGRHCHPPGGKHATKKKNYRCSTAVLLPVLLFESKPVEGKQQLAPNQRHPKRESVFHPLECVARLLKHRVVHICKLCNTSNT